MSQSDSKVLVPLNGLTATTTSSALPIDDVKGVTLTFTRAAHSSGSSVFSVDVSLDGTTYVTYNKLIDNVTNAITEGLTRVAASSSMTANATKTYQMDLENEPWKFMKVKGTRVTDGTITAKVLLRYN